MTSTNWNELYSGEIGDYEAPDPQLVALIHQLPGGRALDVGCGAGGLVTALAQLGWTTAGVDIAENAVAAARLAVERAGVSVELHVGDATSWAPRGQYDLITNSFALPVDVNQRARVFAMMKAALSPGGTILVKEHDTTMVRYPFFKTDDLVSRDELVDAFSDLEIVQAKVEEYEVEERYRTVPGVSETWTSVLLQAKRSGESR